MFYQLPPVGNPVCLTDTAWADALLEAVFSPYQPRYFSSGTAALAAAIQAAIRLTSTDHPEVILPAYGCPDLVSAALFAGAKPVLVDLVEDRPWMDLEQVRAQLGPRTVAIVATNLCGISERMAQLRTIAESTGAVLIEDSAQAFPGGQEAPFWMGDLVVLSFGRGKPVSLLGGGAVLYRDVAFGRHLPEAVAPTTTEWRHQWLFRLKAALYNRLINPRIYWLLQAMPFLHLGETRYEPLTSIVGMDSERRGILGPNVAAYRDDGMKSQKALADMLAELDDGAGQKIDLPRVCQVATTRRLLRYPLLVAPALRNSLYLALRRCGLGPSLLYPAALPGIKGLETLLADQGSFPRAQAFAARILTLPTHQGVSNQDIMQIARVLRAGG